MRRSNIYYLINGDGLPLLLLNTQVITENLEGSDLKIMHKGLFGICFIFLAAFSWYVAISSGEKGNLFTLLAYTELTLGAYFLAFEKARNKFTAWFQSEASESHLMSRRNKIHT
jgi:hypothetical protein